METKNYLECWNNTKVVNINISFATYGITPLNIYKHVRAKIKESLN